MHWDWDFGHSRITTVLNHWWQVRYSVSVCNNATHCIVGLLAESRVYIMEISHLDTHRLWFLDTGLLILMLLIVPGPHTFILSPVEESQSSDWEPLFHPALHEHHAYMSFILISNINFQILMYYWWIWLIITDKPGSILNHCSTSDLSHTNWRFVQGNVFIPAGAQMWTTVPFSGSTEKTAQWRHRLQNYSSHTHHKGLWHCMQPSPSQQNDLQRKIVTDPFNLSLIFCVLQPQLYFHCFLWHFKISFRH